MLNLGGWEKGCWSAQLKMGFKMVILPSGFKLLKPRSRKMAITLFPFWPAHQEVLISSCVYMWAPCTLSVGALAVREWLHRDLFAIFMNHIPSSVS